MKHYLVLSSNASVIGQLIQQIRHLDQVKLPTKHAVKYQQNTVSLQIKAKTKLVFQSKI